MAKTLKALVSEATQGIRNVSVSDVQAWNGENPPVLDVRDPEEYRAGHLDRAINVPRGLLEVKIDPASPAFDPRFQDRQQPIVTYCTGGAARSALAAQTLKHMGFAEVAYLESGLTAWTGAGQAIQS